MEKTEMMNARVQIEQAWLITWRGKNTVEFDEESFIGILHQDITGEIILEIVERIYSCSQLQPHEQIMYIQGKYQNFPKASFTYLNDGSVFEDFVICGNGPYIYARRVYDLVVDVKQSGLAQLTWREPHPLVKDNQRVIDFWEDFALSVKHLSDISR